ERLFRPDLGLLCRGERRDCLGSPYRRLPLWSVDVRAFRSFLRVRKRFATAVSIRNWCLIRPKLARRFTPGHDVAANGTEVPGLEETPMNVAAILKLKGREVVTASPDMSLLEIAQLLGQHKIGCI